MEFSKKINENIFKTLFRRYTAKKIPNLSGDREMEWTYVAARIGLYANKHSHILDFGSGVGVLSFAAASIGASVLAIDLMPCQFQSGYSNLEFQQIDIMSLDERSAKFDLILNCSTIEHVGIPGRYNSQDSPDGDMEAMKKMLTLLQPNGRMILVLPVGVDKVVPPLHRIYGNIRLPKLTKGYEIEESSFLRKNQANIWTPCSREAALVEEGNHQYYALGMMVLKPI